MQFGSVLTLGCVLFVVVSCGLCKRQCLCRILDGCIGLGCEVVDVCVRDCGVGGVFWAGLS